MERLAVVIPAHDEAGAIGLVVADVIACLSQQQEAFIVIPVDDGSEDGTSRIIDELASADSRVRPVHNQMRLGYGGALKAGIHQALELGVDVVVLIDGDGQYDVADLWRVLDALNGDAVFCYRRFRKDARARRILGRVWNWMVDRYLHLDLRDVNCGFKAIRADALSDVQLEASGAVISAEIALGLLRRDRSVGQIAISHHPRRSGRASGADPRVIVTALLELRRLRRLAARARAVSGGPGLGR